MFEQKYEDVKEVLIFDKYKNVDRKITATGKNLTVITAIDGIVIFDLNEDAVYTFPYNGIEGYKMIFDKKLGDELYE